MSDRAVYTVVAAGLAQRAGVVTVSRAAHRRAPDFDCKDEPLLAWLAERFIEARDFRYDLHGSSLAELRVERR